MGAGFCAGCNTSPALTGGAQGLIGSLRGDILSQEQKDSWKDYQEYDNLMQYAMNEWLC